MQPYRKSHAETNSDQDETSIWLISLLQVIGHEHDALYVTEGSLFQNIHCQVLPGFFEKRNVGFCAI